MPACPQQFVGRSIGAGVVAVSLLVTLSVLVPAQPALAQDCGSWSRPVLCEAELVATVEGGGDQRFDGRSSYRLAPRGQMDLELSGRDQRGRRFPAERVAAIRPGRMPSSTRYSGPRAAGPSDHCSI